MPTYYVSAATGNNGDDGLSEGNAWLTIQHALNTVAAGDTVHIKGDGLYQEALTTPAANGTAANPVHYRGYTATPADGGMATVDGNGKVLADGIVYVGVANRYHVWTNIRFTDFSDNGFEAGGSSHFIIRYCEFDNNAGRGLLVKDTSHILCCHSHDNGENGISVDGSCVISGCLGRNDGWTGVEMLGVNNFCIGNTVAGSGGIGIHGSNGLQVIVGNTVWGNNKDTTDGIRFTNTTENLVMNNIVVDCGNGYNSNMVDVWGCQLMVINNLVFDCTTPYVNMATTMGAVTTDPKFTDAANGDFTLAADSPALNVGSHPTNVPNAPSQDGDTHYLGSTSAEAVAAADYPAVGDVQSGVSFDSGAKTGTFTEPGVANVEVGVSYGAGGTEFDGAFAVPAVGDVQSAVKFGNAGTEFTGTFTEPGIANVKQGTTYGGGGTEFTGTMAPTASSSFHPIGGRRGW